MKKLVIILFCALIGVSPYLLQTNTVTVPPLGALLADPPHRDGRRKGRGAPAPRPAARGL